MKEEQYLYLTTTGWKSGKPHEIEIWYVQVGDCYYLVAEHREKAHWVQNIQRNPSIQFRVGAETFAGNGRIIDMDSETDLAAQVSPKMDGKYGWSDGLIVELCPEF